MFEREDFPQRPVRVCFLIDRLLVGGTETQLLSLIEGLDRRRIAPYLCLLDGEDAASRALEPDGCPVLRLGVRSLAHPSTLPKAVRFGRFLRREKIDVLQTYLLDSTYLGVPVARLAGVPHVVRSRRNLGYWMTPRHRLLGKFCNRLTDATVANCEACRQTLLADEGPDPSSVVVLENGIDLTPFENFPAFSARESGLRVGIVANLRPVKALEVFVRAARQVADSHPGAVFEIVGEGPQRGMLERLIQELQLEHRVKLLGAGRNVAGFLATLDVAVLCSHSEGLSNSVIEYMAAGRPTVVTAVGGNVDLIQDEENGLVVPANQPARLAAAISRLLAAPAWAAELAATARRAAWERFDQDAMIRRFENFYLDLARGSSNVAEEREVVISH